MRPVHHKLARFTYFALTLVPIALVVWGFIVPEIQDWRQRRITAEALEELRKGPPCLPCATDLGNWNNYRVVRDSPQTSPSPSAPPAPTEPRR